MAAVRGIRPRNAERMGSIQFVQYRPRGCSDGTSAARDCLHSFGSRGRRSGRTLATLQNQTLFAPMSVAWSLTGLDWTTGWRGRLLTQTAMAAGSPRPIESRGTEGNDFPVNERISSVSRLAPVFRWIATFSQREPNDRPAVLS